jgi:hypothetical protein
MQPDEALAILTQYLRTMALQQYPLDEDGYPIGPDGYTCEATPAPAIAREWCRELLKTAQAEGLGGCRLCQS